MNESTLRTGFVCIATEGKAVDGRDITREWLVDMAETYDPTYYTAVIWPEHDRWSSYGTVQALKTEEVDGKLKLFAVLCLIGILSTGTKTASTSSAPSSRSSNSPIWAAPI